MSILKFRKFLFFLLIFLTSITSYSKTLYRWQELAPDNKIITRAITTNTYCPAGMGVFSEPSKNFPHTVCQSSRPLKINFNPQKIVLIGDTGCRIKKGAVIQDCNNPYQWPFALVAKSAARWKPDLVIHLGDYYYRENPYGDSPSGDNWKAWEADFFNPAKPLLESRAPWIFVRGNHETCERGGKGWFDLLSPFSFKHCHTHTPVYKIKLNNQTQFIIMDSSSASDFTAPPEQITWYTDYLHEADKNPSQSNWLLTHKPFWFIFNDDSLVKTLQANFVSTLQAAWLTAKPNNIDLIFSGHLHRFETVNFGSQKPYRASQVIVGDSGTLLDSSFNRTSLKNRDIAGAKITSGEALSSFGFMTLEKNGSTWRAQLRNPLGKILLHCILTKQNQFIC